MLISEIKSDEDLQKLIIAKDGGNEPYEASGYLVVADKKNAALVQYGHCSCYCTWEVLPFKSGAIQWHWKGTLRQLKKLAIEKLDPHNVLPGKRKADPSDSDYNQLMIVYQQVIKWFEERKKKR